MSFFRRFISALLILGAGLCLWALTSFLISLARAGQWLPQSTSLEKIAAIIACFVLAIGLLSFATQGFFGLIFPKRSDPNAGHIVEWIEMIEHNLPEFMQTGRHLRIESVFEGRLPSLDNIECALKSEQSPLVENTKLILENAASSLPEIERKKLFEEIIRWWTKTSTGKPPPIIKPSS